MSNGWVNHVMWWVLNWITNSWISVINEIDKCDIIHNSVGLTGVVLLVV